MAAKPQGCFHMFIFSIESGSIDIIYILCPMLNADRYKPGFVIPRKTMSKTVLHYANQADRRPVYIFRIIQNADLDAAGFACRYIDNTRLNFIKLFYDIYNPCLKTAQVN